MGGRAASTQSQGVSAEQMGLVLAVGAGEPGFSAEPLKQQHKLLAVPPRAALAWKELMEVPFPEPPLDEEGLEPVSQGQG